MEGSGSGVDVAAVRMLARLGGIALDDDRAARVATSLSLLLAADRSLSEIDLSGFMPSGNPWGRTPDDG